MRRRGAACAAALVAAALGGCGTAFNLNGDNRMYGGVWQDFRQCQEGLEPAPAGKEKPPAGLAGSALALADLPLSLVADTVTLPLTIQATVEKQVDRQFQALDKSPRHLAERREEIEKQIQALSEEKKSIDERLQKIKDAGKPPADTPAPPVPGR